MRSRSILAVLIIVGGTAVFGGAAPAAGSVPHVGSAVHAGEPQTIDPVRGEPVALACPTTDFCAAVVRDADGPARLVRYSGGQSIVTATQDKRTKTVACGTARFCVAGPADAAYVWDGTDWTGPQALGANLGHGPVCAPGTTTCVYVGGARSVVHDATGWRSVPLPHQIDNAFAVSCATATFCEVLDYVTPEPGYYPSEEMAAHFDGTSWHRDADPYVMFGHGTSRLIPNEISCATPTYCLAVTWARGLVQSFDGHTWTKLDEVVVHQAHYMSGLTCVTPGTCFGTKAVITTSPAPRFASAPRFEAIVTYDDGRWTAEKDRNAGEIAGETCGLDVRCYAINKPSVLSCPEVGLCRVVDRQGDIYSIEQGHWSAVDHLLPTQGTLSDVSCASQNWCMAVDSHGNALLWSHGQWSTPEKIDGNKALLSVSCSARRTCVAIDGDQGPDADGVRSGGRAIRYSAGRWHVPEVVDTSSQMQDVSCSTADRCVIVDDHGRVISRKPGGWRAPAVIAQSLGSISCVGPSFCVAGGRTPYVSVHVGGRWKSLPRTPLQTQVLSVACADRRYCLVSGILQTYALGRHGWRNTHARSVGYVRDLGSTFISVSCGSRQFCVMDRNELDSDSDPGFPAVVIRGTHHHQLPRDAAHVSCVGDTCMQVIHSVAYVLRDS